METVRDFILGGSKVTADGDCSHEIKREENFDPYIAVNTAMYGPYILPADICFYSEWEQGQEVWGQLGKYTFAKHR